MNNNCGGWQLVATETAKISISDLAPSLQQNLLMYQKTQNHPHLQNRQTKLSNSKTDKTFQQTRNRWAGCHVLLFALDRRMLNPFHIPSWYHIEQNRLTRWPPQMLAALLSIAVQCVPQRQPQSLGYVSSHKPSEEVPKSQGSQ